MTGELDPTSLEQAKQEVLDDLRRQLRALNERSRVARDDLQAAERQAADARARFQGSAEKAESLTIIIGSLEAL